MHACVQWGPIQYHELILTGCSCNQNGTPARGLSLRATYFINMFRIRHNKRIFYALAVILWFGGFVPWVGAESPAAPAGRPPAAARHLVFGTDQDYPPFEWLDANGQPRGFNVDLIREIGRVMGYNVEVRLGPWHAIRTEFDERHTVDVTDMFYTEEQAKSVDYTAPFWVVHDEIFVRQGTPRISALADLAHRTVFCQKGGTTVELLQNAVPTARLVFADSEPEALRLLSSGQGDCAVVGRLVGRYAIEHYALTNLTTSGPPLWPRNYSFVTRKGHAKLLADLDEGLAILKENGRFNEIYDQWFGETLPRKPWLARLLNWLPWIGLGLLAAATGATAWILTLRHQVRARTREVRESEHRLRLALQAAHLGTFNWDRISGHITWSREHEALFGYKPGEFPGTFEAFSQRVHPDDLPGITAELDRCVTGRTAYRQEFRIRWPDGSMHWIKALGEFEYDDGGQARCMRGAVIDVTDSKQAEESLRHHEAILRETGRIARVGGWEFDPATGRGTWTEEVARIHDLDPAEPTSVEVGISFYTKESRRLIEQALKQAIEAAAPYDLQLEMQTARGHHKWVRTIGHPIVRNGKVVKVRGSFQDITEQKQAEIRIHHLNRTLSLLSDVNQLIVRESTITTMLTDACRIAVEPGGFPLAWIGLIDPASGKLEITAHSGATADTLQVLQILTDGPQPACAFTLHALRAGEHGVCNDVATDPQSAGWRDEALKRGYGSLASLPLKIGDAVVGTFNLYAREPGFFDAEEMRLLDEMAMDISFAMEVERHERQRRKNESELRWRTAFFEAQVDSALDGILVVDNEGRKIVQNQRMTELWGIPPEIAANPDDRVQIEFVTRRTKHPEAFVERVTYLNSNPNDISRDIIELVDDTILDRSSSPVHSKDGTHYGRIWIFRDITQQRQLEEQLRQSQKMEAIGQLAGGVAHDFNNILAAVMIQSELALHTPGLPPFAVGMLAEIRAGADRAARLTRQLLAFSRRQVMQPRQLDLNELVANLARMLQRILGENVRLQLQLHPRQLQVQADAGMLDQVLLNLVVNARDAMPKGGEVVVRTTSAELPAEEAAKMPEASAAPYVCLSVSDTGTGIAAEILPHIFEPFFTTKPQGHGTGLGLATVQGIVKQHHGAITVDSTPAGGTTFTVWLPPCGTTDEAPACEPAPAAAAGGTETILLVEDEATIRELCQIVLESAGYTVLAAADGPEAIRIWDRVEGDIHLLLTDMVMPGGMTGQDLATALRQRQPGLRVVFTTGYSEETAGHDLPLKLGRNFIQKPYTPREILAIIRQSLDTRDGTG